MAGELSLDDILGYWLEEPTDTSITVDLALTIARRYAGVDPEDVTHDELPGIIVALRRLDRAIGALEERLRDAFTARHTSAPTHVIGAEFDGEDI